MNESDAGKELLRGAIDSHIHSAPSHFPRLVSDIDAARQAAEHGMGAIVIKCHLESTVGRSIIAGQIVKDVKVIGGLVLNYPFGFNPLAVKSAIDLGATAHSKVVTWMPTIHSKNEMSNLGGQRPIGMSVMAQIPSDKPGLSVLDDRGNILHEVEDILHLIAESDNILATGHISVPEQKKLIQKARDIGVRRILVPHPEVLNQFASPEFFNRYAMNDFKEVAAMGAFFQPLYAVTRPPRNISAETIAGTIQEVGVKHFILATDGGAARHNMIPVEMLAHFAQDMISCGISERDVRTMIVDNPGSLLGLT